MAFSKIVDLSHALHKDIPVWPGDPPFKTEQAASHTVEKYYLNKFCMGEHTGSHFGAPVHFNADGQCVDQIEGHRLVQPVVKIDVSCFAAPDFLVQPQHVLDWQQVHGKIDKGTVLFQTGWSKYWDDHAAYWGGTSHDRLHFPGISPACVELLLDFGIAGIGIDTGGIDGGQSRSFRANKLLARQQKYHLENLTRLELIPETGALLFIGVLPLCGGSGSPCRVLAVF